MFRLCRKREPWREQTLWESRSRRAISKRCKFRERERKRENERRGEKELKRVADCKLYFPASSGRVMTLSLSYRVHVITFVTCAHGRSWNGPRIFAFPSFRCIKMRGRVIIARYKSLCHINFRNSGIEKGEGVNAIGSDKWGFNDDRFRNAPDWVSVINRCITTFSRLWTSVLAVIKFKGCINGAGGTRNI